MAKTLKMDFKQLLMIISVFVLIVTGKAQITITGSDMPIANQIFNIVNAVPNSMDPSLTGENYFWDYSDIDELNTVQDTALSLDNAPDLFQLFFNNPFIYPGYVSDFGFTGQDLSLGTVNASNVLNFYRVTSSTYEATGFGTELNGSPIPVLYDPKDIVYEFPMNYTDSTYSFAHFEVQIPTIGYWEEDIERINEVDGWGMVTTPAGTFEVLRVKTTLNLIDSVYIDLFMTGTTIVQPTRTEYKWIAKNMGIPVLTITDLDTFGMQVTYLNEIVDEIDEIHSESTGFYPNPAHHSLHLTNSNFDHYEIIDLSGRSVMKGVLTNVIDISSLQPGNYLIRLDQSTFKKFIKLNQ